MTIVRPVFHMLDGSAHTGQRQDEKAIHEKVCEIFSGDAFVLHKDGGRSVILNVLNISHVEFVS